MLIWHDQFSLPTRLVVLECALVDLARRECQRSLAALTANKLALEAITVLFRLFDLTMWHIVSPSTLVGSTVCLGELALSSSFSLIEFAVVDVAVCIDTFSSAVWNAAPKVAFVDRAGSRMKLTVPMALILIELALVFLAIRSCVLSIGFLALLERALEERAIGMSHLT